MPCLSVEFEVYCSCGAGLCNNSREGAGTNGHSQYITVEPCSDCSGNSYDEGYNSGHTEGYNEGLDKGHNEGYDEGYNEGCDEGHEEGGL